MLRTLKANDWTPKHLTNILPFTILVAEYEVQQRPHSSSSFISYHFSLHLLIVIKRSLSTMNISFVSPSPCKKILPFLIQFEKDSVSHICTLVHYHLSYLCSVWTAPVVIQTLLILCHLAIIVFFLFSVCFLPLLFLSSHPRCYPSVSSLPPLHFLPIDAIWGCRPRPPELQIYPAAHVTNRGEQSSQNSLNSNWRKGAQVVVTENRFWQQNEVFLTLCEQPSFTESPTQILLLNLKRLSVWTPVLFHNCPQHMPLNN